MIAQAVFATISCGPGQYWYFLGRVRYGRDGRWGMLPLRQRLTGVLLFLILIKNEERADYSDCQDECDLAADECGPAAGEDEPHGEEGERGESGPEKGGALATAVFHFAGFPEGHDGDAQDDEMEGDSDADRSALLDAFLPPLSKTGLLGVCFRKSWSCVEVPERRQEAPTPLATLQGEKIDEGVVVFPAVGFEVALVGGEDAAVAEVFGEEDEGGVGEVHGEVAVFVG